MAIASTCIRKKPPEQPPLFYRHTLLMLVGMVIIVLKAGVHAGAMDMFKGAYSISKNAGSIPLQYLTLCFTVWSILHKQYNGLKTYTP